MSTAPIVTSGLCWKAGIEAMAGHFETGPAKLKFALSAFTLALLAFASPSNACSVVDDYRVPTNLELVRKTELIVLAKVRSGTPMGDGSPGTMQITIEAISALKGIAPESPIDLEGLAIAPDRFAVLSNPYEFQSAHPLSYIGGCIRYMFPLGTTALFFLEKRDGKWGPNFAAFSRWAEDAPGLDSPWPKLVSLYVRASKLPENEAKSLLEEERAKLDARRDDPVARLMASDIARQLAGPNKPWNRVMDDMTPKD